MTTQALPTNGFAQLQVTVLSVEGDMARVRDQLGRERTLRRDLMRAKGQPPQPGETWMIDRAYANTWAFAMITGATLATLAGGPVIPVADRAARDALAAPYRGMTVHRADQSALNTYDGTTWRGVSAIPYTGTNTFGTSTTYSGSVGAVLTPFGLTVPDPGWPYRVRVTGAMAGSALNNRMHWVVAVAGTPLQTTFVDLANIWQAEFPANITAGVFTGATTVTMTTGFDVNGTSFTTSSAASAMFLAAEAVPA